MIATKEALTFSPCQVLKKPWKRSQGIGRPLKASTAAAHHTWTIFVPAAVWATHKVRHHPTLPMLCFRLWQELWTILPKHKHHHQRTIGNPANSPQQLSGIRPGPGFPREHLCSCQSNRSACVPIHVYITTKNIDCNPEMHPTAPITLTPPFKCAAGPISLSLLSYHSSNFKL